MVDGVTLWDGARPAFRWPSILRVAALGVALAVLPPVASHAAPGATTGDPTAQTVLERVHTGQRALLLDLPRPTLAPGLPPPDFTTVSDRRIISGGILLLLAGFGGLTALMWRELGIRSKAR